MARWAAHRRVASSLGSSGSAASASSEPTKMSRRTVKRQSRRCGAFPSRGLARRDLGAGALEGDSRRNSHTARRTLPAFSGVAKDCAKKAAIDKLAPHDLRRTCARLCRDAGGELDQIQFLLGHVSVQTTERYLGCKERLRNAVNDLIGIERNC